jgi:hypothetical protein
MEKWSKYLYFSVPAICAMKGANREVTTGVLPFFIVGLRLLKN